MKNYNETKHENSPYKEIFSSKVSYGFRFFYYPFIITGLCFLAFVFSLFLSFQNPEASSNRYLLLLSMLLFFTELILLRVLATYRRVRLYHHNESFIIEISEANRVLFVKEFDKIEYWWNYQSIDKGEILVNGSEEKDNQLNVKKRFQLLLSSVKNDNTGKSLPRTLFVKLIFHDEEVILYETLGYFDDIPHNFPYSIQINKVHAESYKLGKLVDVILKI